MVQVKRVYDVPKSDGSTRFLVERLWPRSMKKEALHLDDGLKDVAPSAALRRWFKHDPNKWAAFRRRYFAELDRNPEAWQPIREATRQSHVTLFYGARDTEHNNALALKDYVEAKLGNVGA
jgi:uncharacterized protein YeaO (DUF488 family)